MPPTTYSRDSRDLLALSAPLALTQFAQVALTTTDTIMMGVLGTGALAAGGLAIVLYNQVRTMGVGLVTALGNQIATTTAEDEAAGRADDHVAVRAQLHSGLVLATLAGLAGAVLLALFGPLLTLLGQDPDVVAAASPMMVALAPGLMCALWFQVVRQYTVGMRRPRAIVWITVGGIAVNAGLNWVLIHGLFGLPRMGLTGIGAATSVVQALSLIVLIVMVRADEVLAPALSLRGFRIDTARLRSLWRLGAPIAATYGSEAGFFSVVAILIGGFGAAALAAHTVVNQLVYIVFQFSVGISHAASVLISRTKVLHPDRVTRIGTVAVGHGTLVAATAAVVYSVAPGLVLGGFVEAGDSAVLAVAGQLLIVAAILQFADSAQNIGIGLLRGLGDTRGGFRLTLVGYWLIGLPAAWLLGHALDLGAVGAWIGLLTGLVATAAMLLRRFARLARREVPAEG